MNEIADKVFLIEVPLPKNPLRTLNSYLIKGGDRNLLIDTGFNSDICYEALKEGLEDLDVDMEKTDIFLTHLHSDHSGLCGRIASPRSRVLIGEKDRDILQGMAGNMEGFMRRERLLALGFSADEIEFNKKHNPLVAYKPPAETEYTCVFDGEIIEIGDYRLRAVETPGHTPGHLCLYDEQRGLFFSGDHILFGISPNITNWPDFQNPLGAYMESLRAVKGLDVATTLCSHRNPGGDFYGRIDQLLEHHAKRIEEALEIVAACPNLSAYEAASKMSWKIRANGWDDFPIAQKWFATGEAAAHLDYLEAQSLIRKELLSGVTRYHHA